MRGRNGPVYIVGLMSGTSADGIDAVVAEFSGEAGPKRCLEASVKTHVHTPFSSAFRERIHRACSNGGVAEICDLNFVLGERFAVAALEVIAHAGLKPSEILAIGSHGQTVHHLAKTRKVSTLQIGEAAVIAERTGITTVADFRVRDVAAGGQGAPLVPFADWALFTSKERPRIIQNIGGIANLTFLPATAKLDDVLAFDTGPGNMVIDALVREFSKGRRTYDVGGEWAASGRASAALLKQLLKHRFLRRRPPRTTGREEFGDAYLREVLSLGKVMRLPPQDVVATATEFTAETIVEAVERFVLPLIAQAQKARLQVILGGGGAKNAYLVSALRRRLEYAELLTHEDLGIANESKEAMAFAILAWQTLRGQPGNVPSATGAARRVVLGKIVPGSKFLAWPIR